MAGWVAQPRDAGTLALVGCGGEAHDDRDRVNRARARESAMRTSSITVKGGPPRRRGHYSDDGEWWWDEERQRWLRTTLPVDRLTIELEDVGHTSRLRSIITTLTGPFGTQAYEFVGRARSDDPRWLSYTVSSAAFPVAPGANLDHLGSRDAWADEISQAFRELEETLAEEGWRLVETGDHWWAQTYTRPAVDADTPPGAGPPDPARG